MTAKIAGLGVRTGLRDESLPSGIRTAWRGLLARGISDFGFFWQDIAKHVLNNMHAWPVSNPPPLFPRSTRITLMFVELGVSLLFGPLGRS